MQITIKDLDLNTARNILSTAIESGISYWVNEECTDVEVTKSPDFGNSNADINLWYYLGIKFNSDCQGEGQKFYELTPEMMMEDFSQFMEYCREKTPWRFHNWIKWIEQRNLDGIDAEEADVFIQFCFFGDVVFG